MPLFHYPTNFLNQSSCEMNSKLEELLLSKDFDHLSSHDKLFVTEFMTEFEYDDYRQLLMRSKQVFQSDRRTHRLFEQPGVCIFYRY